VTARGSGPAGKTPESPETRRAARRERRRAARRCQLLDSARELLARGGLEGFTAAALAEAADVSKTSLFYYWESLDDLLEALALEELRAEERAVLDAIEAAPDGVEALAALVRAVLATHRGRLDLFRALQAWLRSAGAARHLFERELVPRAAAINDGLEAMLRAEQRAGRLHPEVHPRRLANVAYVSAMGLVSLAADLRALGGSTRFGLDELCEEACRALVRAAQPPPAR